MDDLCFIDAQGRVENLYSPKDDSDDESTIEVPKFKISAFKKFASEDAPNPKIKENFHNKSIQLASSLNAGKDYTKSTYINFDNDKNTIQTHVSKQKEILKKMLDENLKKSIVCQPDFEKKESVPTFQSRRQKRKESAKEREKTKGFNWYNMAAPEMTDEKQNDLLVLKMRQALDPKHFYKRSANNTNPKFFQVGTFVESPIDFYSSRIPKKQRKQTLVDELLADTEFRQYQKKKFTEIQRSQLPKYVRKKKMTHRQRVEARSADVQKKSKKVKKNKKKA
ncbi:Deoxynucleotidyltransferase terminal-interacting protein 2 [Araneus ventricosus]|uniref:Deoxynucleotidyltransferase terminal-interacting protein 2 n=1 Tax=Araneus ventricosus TaxID=182803 RepID=A0A4Y2C035_ARAVE|nr:Deoxynucleotidyltransferase terminal-interacting protein 2 [Araneus ventricosus]